MPASSLSKKIVAHLEKQGIAFEVVSHRTVYTAYDLAQTTGEKLESVAKTLLVKADRYYVIVLPASSYVDMGKLKKVLKAKRIDFVPERVMAKLGIEPGALTPFGSLRGFGVVVDRALLKSTKVLVGAESFTEHLRMKSKDLVKAEESIVAPIGKKNTMKLQRRAIPKRKPKKGKKYAKRARATTTKTKRRKSARRPAPVRRAKAAKPRRATKSRRLTKKAPARGGGKRTSRR